MKKLLASMMVATLALSGCATQNAANTGQTNGLNTATAISSGMVFGKTMFQTAVTNKCHTELAKNNVWNTAKKVLTPAQQSQLPANVCNCVGAESVKNVTIDQLTIAALDKNSRNILVANAVTNTLTSCYGQFMKF